MTWPEVNYRDRQSVMVLRDWLLDAGRHQDAEQIDGLLDLFARIEAGLAWLESQQVRAGVLTLWGTGHWDLGEMTFGEGQIRAGVPGLPEHTQGESGALAFAMQHLGYPEPRLVDVVVHYLLPPANTFAGVSFAPATREEARGVQLEIRL